MKLIVKALRTNETQNQLGIDCAFIDEMKSQTDDQAEFNLLTQFLNLDPSFKTCFQVPTELQESQDESAFEDMAFENVKYGILGATTLSSDLES